MKKIIEGSLFVPGDFNGYRYAHRNHDLLTGVYKPHGGDHSILAENQMRIHWLLYGREELRTYK